MAEVKPLSGNNRVLLEKVLPLETPFSVYIFPTNACNFRCNYCAQSLGKTGLAEQFGITPSHMDIKTFAKIVEQLKMFPQKIRTVNLTGHGEPLLNPALPDMIQMLKKADVTNHIEFISNASVLTPKLSKRLIDAGLDTIRISLQGLSADKYQEICGYKLDYVNFVENIRWFFQNKKQCRIFIKIMDIALNPGEEYLFYDTFSPIADRVFIEACKPVYQGVKSTDDIPVTSDRYGREHSPRIVCPLCFFMLGIFPNGDISPCETIYKPELLGNVSNTTLVDAWSGAKRRDFLKMQLEKKRYEHPQCRRCSAPDDVSHPEDVLDNAADALLERMGLLG